MPYEISLLTFINVFEVHLWRSLRQHLLIKVTFSGDVGRGIDFLTLDLKARRILGKKRTKHFRLMVKYLRTKSVMPTAQIRSKKSKLLRLGLANMRLEKKKKTR